MAIQGIIELIIAITTIILVLVIKLVKVYANGNKDKWIEWATEIGMNYTQPEKKGFFRRMKEYERDIKNPQLRIRKDKVMTGSSKGSEITGYFVHEVERVGTKERIRPTKFELEFENKSRNYPELIIKRRNLISDIFVKTPKSMKIDLPPKVENIFEATSARPEKVKELVHEITPLLTKDVKNLKILMSNFKITISIPRARVNSERLFAMKKIGSQLADAGEKFTL